jgi:ubiquitin-protein ligase
VGGDTSLSVTSWGKPVNVGGSLCLEMLTMTGWQKDYSIEYVLMNVHQALSDLDPVPARIDNAGVYSVKDAVTAYIRVANSHGWSVPQNWDRLFNNIR